MPSKPTRAACSTRALPTRPGTETLSRQLAFELPARAALGRGDFFVSPSNAAALAAIEDWRAWPLHRLALAGPAGAGKSHLVQVWAALSGARAVRADEIDAALVERETQRSGALALDDANLVAGSPAAEEALFHLVNLMQAGGRALLLTGQAAPAGWPIRLPDLASRLHATGVARLDEPDDALLSAVLVKLFADRQLSVGPQLIGYLTRRIDRSFSAAARVVAALDRAALEDKRAVTRALAATVLDKLPPDTT